MSKHGMLGSLLGLILVAGLVGHTAGATDSERDDAQTIAAAGAGSPGPARVADRIARDLNASWGRSPAPYTAASVTAQRVQNRWGWGETLITNRLAQQMANKLLAQPVTR